MPVKLEDISIETDKYRAEYKVARMSRKLSNDLKDAARRVDEHGGWAICDRFIINGNVYVVTLGLKAYTE